MQCTRIRELLSQYIDGLLDLHTKALVETHLQSCTECSKTLEELQTIVQTLRELDPVPAPANFIANVNKRLAKRTWARQLFEAFFVPVKIKLPLQFAAAAIAAIIVITLSYKIKPDVDIATRAPELKQKEVQTKPELFTDSSAPGSEKQDRLGKVALEKDQPEKHKSGRIIELSLTLKQDMQGIVRDEKREGVGMKKAETEESLPVQPLSAPAAVRRKEAKSSIQKNGFLKPKPQKKAFKDHDYKDALAQIQALTTRLGGNVVDILHSAEPHEKARTITVKIPSSSYENFLAELKQTGTLQPHVEAPTQENIMITVRIHLLRFPPP